MIRQSGATDVVLGARYRLERRLAVGGMGSVWEAEDTVLGRQVAVKLPSPTLAADPRFIERFRFEARAAARLTHPNIASVFDYGQDSDTPFIVMELVHGETLANVLQRRGTVPPGDASRIAAEIADGLDAAHRAQIVHRDVKPGNVMLTPSGGVKVMDFGIAAAVDAAAGLTSTGSLVGTAAYMAPERTAGKPATPASDVYSLGVVLYEMVAAELPFRADTPLATALAHLREPPPPLQGVPPSVATACARALVKDPNQRLPSARAFAQMLRTGDEEVAHPGVVRASTAAPAEAVPATEVLGGDKTSILAPERTPTIDLPARSARRARSRPFWSQRQAAVITCCLVLAVLALWAIAEVGGGGHSPPRPSPTQHVTRRPPSPSTTVLVPNVFGQTIAAATHELQGAGLRVAVVPAGKAHGAPVGTVLSTDPPAGTRLVRDAPVTLYVSTGHHHHGKHNGENGNGD